MNLEAAQNQLEDFIATYQKLTEKEKFALSKVFQDKTGGKLSPFNSPSPVCVALVPVQNESGEVGFLGIRRAIPPFVGGVALAGGFLETNEDPALGVVREVFEETGIDLSPQSFAPDGLPKMGHNNNMLMFFKSSTIVNFAVFQEAANAIQERDSEASELVFITPQTELCFPLHQEAVNRAFENLNITPQVAVSKSFKP